MSRIDLASLMLVHGVTNYPEKFGKISVLNYPFPHQSNTFKKYLKSKSLLDASEPGTGKTFPAMLKAVLSVGLGKKVCFSMPPKVVPQFIQELKDYFIGYEDYYTIGTIKGTKVPEGFVFPDILVLSYDGYRSLNDSSPFKKVGKNLCNLVNGVLYTKDWRLVSKTGMAENPNRFRLLKEGYEVYFYDEAHYLCGTDSIISKSVKALPDSVERHLMTGTPIPTKLENVYGLIRILSPTTYGSKANFYRNHCILRKMEVKTGVKVEQVIGYKNVDKLHEVLFRNAVRVQKRDVIQLKEPVITSTIVSLSQSHMKLYKQIVEDAFAIIDGDVVTPESGSEIRTLALRTISNPGHIPPEENELYKSLESLLDSISPAEHKVIIFCYFKNTVRYLARLLSKWNPSLIFGEENEIVKFKTDDSSRIAIVNWKSGGAGLNLQMASHIIFYECPTSPADAKQAIARCDRAGQVNVVNVYFMRVIGTYLDKSFRDLLKNEETGNSVLRDKKDLLHEVLRSKLRKPTNQSGK